MLFSIAVALMVILITAFWAYQGFFSSMIMFLESIIAAMIAFTYYEAVNGLWVEQLGPRYGLPLALMALFLSVLLILRMLTDKLIPRGFTLPLYVDRAGGGLCGFFTGMMLVGMALIGIQMLPLGSSVLGFERFTTDKNGNPQEHNFLFSPDRFAAATAGMLSNGRFAGDHPFIQAKPDLVLDLYSARAAPQPEARIYLPENVLTVKAYWETRQIDRVIQSTENDTLDREFETTEPVGANNKFLVCYTNIDAAAAKQEKLEIRFRVPQFRIVGPPPGPDGKFTNPPHVYLAVGVSDIYTHKEYGLKSVGPAQATRLVRFPPQTDFILGPNQTKAVAKLVKQGSAEVCKTWRFDVAFEVPEDFEPWYMEFKRGARADLTTLKKSPTIPDWASRALGQAGPSGRVAQTADKVGKAPGGRTHVANAIDERTGASNLLPVTLSRSDPVVSRFASGQRLRGDENCHFWVELPDDEIPSNEQVREFDVPGNKRMIQIGAEVLQAESMYGRALNFASRIAAQIRITDSNGNDYFAIGQYAAADIGGKGVFEIQYHPNAGMPERCLKKPRKITHSVMKQVGRENSKFGYLFLVEPGAKIVSFHAGRGQSQKLNIQAPQ